jgi:hypothetical protein
MRCGHCKEQHDTVVEVRSCAAVDLVRPPVAQPFKRTSDKPKVEITEGIWVIDGGEYEGIYKVQIAHYGSGRLYGKKFYGDSEAATGEWNIIRGAVRILSENGGREIQPQEAAEFGRLYGRCVRCSKILTREESIERAMGPICWSKMFGGL